MNAFQYHDLCNIAAHGVKDLRSQGAGYFTFSQIPEPLTEHHARLLDMLVPLLHQALVRSIGKPDTAESQSDSGTPALTTREIEILRRLSAGNTSAEIATLLNRSAHTVKNQMRSVYQKLGVNNRARAITAAMNLRLLSS